jgi:hypothetical protein
MSKDKAGREAKKPKQAPKPKTDPGAITVKSSKVRKPRSA